jgi:hypothetical protein
VNNQILLKLALNRSTMFPASASLSHATSTANATGSTTFTLKQNGSAFATINYGAGSGTGTFTQASNAQFVAGDVLEIDGPATADATLAGVGITLAGCKGTGTSCAP